MRKLFLLLIISCGFNFSQAQVINRQEFFIEEAPIEVTLTSDIRNLLKEKKVPAWQPADISMKFSDSLTISEKVRVQPRGEFRKYNCDIASLSIGFKNATSPRLSPLKKLKLVGGCKAGKQDEELLLKEYLIYKIFNHVTNMSFRVRLLRVKYACSNKSIRPYTQYAFLIEDTKDMMDRNNCFGLEADYFTSESTDRDQMTIINLFQYMIGNTDWAVPKLHNMKLMISKNDSLSRPYAVPYDFDYCGMVDASYAVPPEQFGTTSVTERVYRGFPRTMEELEQAIRIFQEKKSVILYTVDHFELLSETVRNKMHNYIEEFYKIIGNKKQVSSVFIKDARKE